MADRKELLEADFSWWITFFSPALHAYATEDYEKLNEVVKRYKEFNGY